jgi:hypothetical protein
MRFSRKSIYTAAAAVVGLGSGLVSSQADAGLIYDLRLAGGGTSVPVPVAGQTYTLELWGQVTGADTSGSNERLKHNYVTVASSGGNALAGVTWAPGTVQFDPETGDPLDSALYGKFAGAGSRQGASTDVNSDGVADWGSGASNLTDTNYMLARSDAVPGQNRVGLTIGTDYNALNAPAGTEFKIAVWKLTMPGSIGAGSTTFRAVQPAALVNGGTGAEYATYVLDGAATTTSVNPANVGNTYTTDGGVTFGVGGVVPEPASLGLLGAAAVGLFGRRRTK